MDEIGDTLLYRGCVAPSLQSRASTITFDILCILVVLLWYYHIRSPHVHAGYRRYVGADISPAGVRYGILHSLSSVSWPYYYCATIRHSRPMFALDAYKMLMLTSPACALAVWEMLTYSSIYKTYRVIGFSLRVLDPGSFLRMFLWACSMEAGFLG